jgi:hydroxyethylthiazole kinase-like uncharacterized protein yjeF
MAARGNVTTGCWFLGCDSMGEMIERVAKLPSIPARPIGGHKGLFGRVLVVGGDDDMLGAPVLAGSAALRAGSGLVQIAVPSGILAAALSVMPELIGLGLERGASSDKKLREAIEAADVVAVGPGLGQSADAARRLQIIYKYKKRIVVDADALNLISKGRAWPKGFAAEAVLTPHPGEMKRLCKLLGGGDVPKDDQERIELALRASAAFGQVLLLKGERTVVARPAIKGRQSIYVNHTGDSSLSKAGAGDVLTGLISSLIGQGMELFEAACAGAYIHGRAGEMAGKSLGRRSVVARDVIEGIGGAILEYEKAFGVVSGPRGRKD